MFFFVNFGADNLQRLLLFLNKSRQIYRCKLAAKSEKKVKKQADPIVWKLKAAVHSLHNFSSARREEQIFFCNTTTKKYVYILKLFLNK